jgi:hypothetical protein
MMRRLLTLVGACAVASCADSTGVTTDPSRCDASTAAPLALGVGQSVTVTGAAAGCAQARDAGLYLVSPQLTGAVARAARYATQIGSPGASIDPPAGTILGIATEHGGAADAFERRMRAFEQRVAADAAVRLGQRERTMHLREVPSLGAASTFSVLNTLAATEAFASVRATAVYVGTSVIVYADTAAVAAFASAQWTAFGEIFDRALHPAAVAAFGATSDLDGNGRTIVLFTPVVNALVSEIDCARLGYVNGFFFANDLRLGAPGGNDGEIFYSYVPDPAGRWSCPHAAAEVRETIPPTFIHELQHMISFHQHVLVRRGAPEVTWLNEGLSHVAEELGGRIWEQRYPAPSGRANTTRLLPDSAYPYLRGNLTNATRWLEFPTGSSLSVLAEDSPGTLGERGAAWLFLRWLAAQRGAGVFRGLVQTAQVGTRNIEAVSGRPFAANVADFATALWMDSLPGAPRPTEPRRTFGDRNLRALFFEFQQRDPARASSTFPLTPLTLAGEQRRLLGVPAGGFGLVHWQATAGALLSFRRPDNRAFGDTLGAQVVVTRVQ